LPERLLAAAAYFAAGLDVMRSLPAVRQLALHGLVNQVDSHGLPEDRLDQGRVAGALAGGIE
jgi:hypothetical protein